MSLYNRIYSCELSVGHRAHRDLPVNPVIILYEYKAIIMTSLRWMYCVPNNDPKLTFLVKDVQKAD